MGQKVSPGTILVVMLGVAGGSLAVIKGPALDASSSPTQLTVSKATASVVDARPRIVNLGRLRIIERGSNQQGRGVIWVMMSGRALLAANNCSMLDEDSDNNVVQIYQLDIDGRDGGYVVGCKP